MKLELQNQLTKSYPVIFSNRYGDPKETCMAWGIECGDGWYHIIDSLCEAIQAKVDWVNRCYPQIEMRVVAEQVKEKYGTLRFYVWYKYTENPENLSKEDSFRLNNYIEEVNGMIRMAESMSKRTCEVCGNHGKINDGVWLMVRCAKCENLSSSGQSGSTTYTTDRSVSQ